MESAYLKSTVGPVLARGIAETIAAQPNNPQEYLALYLLHYIQEKDKKNNDILTKKKADEQRSHWAEKQALKEKRAVNIIQAAFQRFKLNLNNKKKHEQKMQELYEETTEEAERLLEELTITPAEGDDEGEEANNNNNNNNNNSNNAATTNESNKERLDEAKEALEEARDNFFKIQRFSSFISKKDIGELKLLLNDTHSRQDIYSQKDEAEYLLFYFLQRESDEEETSYTKTKYLYELKKIKQLLGEEASSPSPPDTTPSVQALYNKLLNEQKHNHASISLPMAVYRIFRIFIYLLFPSNISTPKNTENPAHLSQSIKPFIFIKLLQAFNPIASYDKVHPFKLERYLPKNSELNNTNEDENSNNKKKNNDANDDEEDEKIFVPQPSARQVRRASRLLRVLLQDMEDLFYFNPKEYLINKITYLKEKMEQQSPKGEGEEAPKNNNAEKNEEEEEEENDDDLLNEDEEELVDEFLLKNNLARSLQERYEENNNTKKTLLPRLEEKIKKRGGFILFYLLEYIRAALTLREARDYYVYLNKLLETSLPQAASLSSEQVEEMDDENKKLKLMLGDVLEDNNEAEDELNEEFLLNEQYPFPFQFINNYFINNPENNNANNEDEEIDTEALEGVMRKVGTDTDEALAKAWERNEKSKIKIINESFDAFRKTRLEELRREEDEEEM